MDKKTYEDSVLEMSTCLYEARIILRALLEDVPQETQNVETINDAFKVLKKIDDILGRNDT